MRIAEDQHRDFREVMRTTTSTDFVLLKARRSRKVNDFHREDYFLAEIAYLVAMFMEGFAGKSLGIERSKFMHKFHPQIDEELAKADDELKENLYSDEYEHDLYGWDPEEEHQETEEAAKLRQWHTDMAKAYWFTIAGLDAEGKPIKTTTAPKGNDSALGNKVVKRTPPKTSAEKAAKLEAIKKSLEAAERAAAFKSTTK